MASEYEGPGLRVPVKNTNLAGGKKRTRQRHPPGAAPTQGAHAEPGRERGPGPPTRAGEARAPRGAGRLRERRKEKGDCGELQLAVCKRKYEGAELRHGRPKPAAASKLT